MLDYAFAPMEMRIVEEIPREPGWLYEPKWDGFRALAFRDGDEIALQSKSGQPLARYFPEVVSTLHDLQPSRFVLDGELVVLVDGALAFDVLQQRIHPAASRIAKLSREVPALYLAFDILSDGVRALIADPLADRRRALERLAGAFPSHGGVRLSPATHDLAVAERWFAQTGGALDGVIAKRLDREYASGKRDAAVKVKRIRTADCVVGGFRYAANTREAVGSLLLGLFDDAGRLDYVGFTSSFSSDERRTLLQRLLPLVEAPGFTGRSPGGPSRWNRGADRDTSFIPLRTELVLEVSYDQVTAGRFRHGTRARRWRTDKAPQQCALDQLESPGRMSGLLA
ncbi:MAG: ATP-dependent DNA ligase [Candidatus Velthaea sp.]